ncbi:MAG TPA: hypothetical protein VNI84_15945 [Pyrinomonadaceae bacterium]|nr:hypothetical protein [Pyrinomonadaceae bacterium]
MNKTFRHTIFRHYVLRSYIALARAERLMPSEIGETLDFVAPYSGRLVGSYDIVQLELSGNDAFEKRICADLNLTGEQFFEQMIFPKPTPLANLLYSARLRRVFGMDVLRFMSEFDKDGSFKLEPGKGFIIPQIEENRISTLKFYDYRSSAAHKLRAA